MNNNFMKVSEVAQELGISESYAYKLMKKLNMELEDMGYFTISGKVCKAYFLEKFCYKESKERKE